jgi:tyrosine-protein phosphatase YwqE
VVLCVNAGSLWGEYGSEPLELARGMLARGEADLVGSDNHGRPHRSDTVAEARSLLVASGHRVAADRLVSANPLAILDGGDLEAVPPVELECGEPAGSPRRRWWDGLLGAGGA